MAGGYRSGSGDQYDALVEELRTVGRRIAELETPTGTSLNDLLEQVQRAIADINTTVTSAINLNSYTKTQIDSRISNPPYDVTMSAKLNVPDAVTFVITGVRRAIWAEDATGRLGNTSSSRRFKQDIRPAGIDVDAFLSVGDFWFHYIAEVRKRDDPDFEGYVGPEYVVPDEFGLMAEDLHEAGLTYWVYYDADGHPEGVNYTMLVVPLLAAARRQQQQINDLTARVEALEAKGTP